jgi:hypothetical protein
VIQSRRRAQTPRAAPVRLTPLNPDRRELVLLDMTNLTFQDRKVFLLNAHTQLTARQAPLYIPADLMDCLLTASTPLHRQVAEPLSVCISDVILANPEVSEPFLEPVLDFLLRAQRCFAWKSVFTAEVNPFTALLDTLLLEVNPSALIAAALEKATNKAYHVEHFVNRLFVQHPEIELGQSQLFTVASWLWHDVRPEALHLSKLDGRASQPIHVQVLSNLLTALATKQPVLFARFVETQAALDRPELFAYLPPEPEADPKSDDDDGEFTGEPMAIVVREFREGNEAKLVQLANALERITPKSYKHLQQLFGKVLKFLGSLDEGRLERHREVIKRICFSQFSHAKLLAIFAKPGVAPDLICGFSRFVWHCDPRILKSADEYYAPLYETFKRAPGETRVHLVLIFLAIEAITKQSVTKLQTMDKLHAGLITRMLEQYAPGGASGDQS